MSEKNLEAQADEQMDALILNDISAEVEEREAKRVLRSIEQRRLDYKDQITRLVQARQALRGDPPLDETGLRRFLSDRREKMKPR